MSIAGSQTCRRPALHAVSLCMGGGRDGALRLDGEDPPGSRHAFEVVLAAVGQGLAGPDAEVADGAADEHLTRTRQTADPCADVYGERAHTEHVVGDLRITAARTTRLRNVHRATLPASGADNGTAPAVDDRRS